MKTNVFITFVVYQQNLTTEFEELFRKLAAAYPEGVKHAGWLICNLPETDPRVSAILAILADCGCRPAWIPKYPKDYRFRIERIYERKDIEPAELLIFYPCATYSQVGPRDEDGRVELELGPGAGRAEIGSASFTPIVKMPLKEEILAAGLIGPAFKETMVKRRGKLEPVDEFWELTSTVQMPPLNSKCVLQTADGEPYHGDPSKGCFIREGFFEAPELHYDRSAISALTPFDVAVTRERFGNGEPAVWPQYVCSKRFYEFCVERKLKMIWRPVRIDEG